MTQPSPSALAYIERLQREREHWGRVHIAADRRRSLRPGLFPRLGRYLGEGCRRQRGGWRMSDD